mmetsp:Transcript_89769/g.134543  ORF Transcript_89769/g.134543 Transcript_89769/m.134543 type:complete len:138 (+) Transcript_89769:42-455(+)|eukprot:CAMPEP_0117045232 /NCGR_PEP_ID=MMETSP0472-20121206/31291_1 /TAXON_ID=693140 ORGANISM="Tiarina fusus, Strain LIS" /NCGR_SAMPLE_ID=MMETSP0472 /ASSEMBLY_ACC=CAM_ASM_000603 /LENGTH=137 /DNA_ID=CAMNT_0004757153 /DNA_START=29 /DNA_END=442 /DNA_ORIENTATION=+
MLFSNKRSLLQAFLCCLLFLCTSTYRGVLAQDQYGDNYDYGSDYGQDNLYHDYAIKQQEKEVGKAASGGWGRVLIGTAAGWLIGGKIHSGRKEKKINAKHKEEIKAMYTQYYNDVYTLQQQNQELAEALEQLGVRVR